MLRAQHGGLDDQTLPDTAHYELVTTAVVTLSATTRPKKVLGTTGGGALRVC
jgi:hypothetical protein